MRHGTCRKQDEDAIYVDQNTRIQVLDSVTLLGTADKEQCGAFIVSQASDFSGSI